MLLIDTPTRCDPHAMPLRPGQGYIDLSRVAGRTAVTRAAASSPLKLLTPRRSADSAWIYTSSFGGGLVAGDQIDLRLHAHPGTRTFLGTQASTKVYRSPAGRPCTQTLRATVDDGAVLVVAPDPLTCFARSIFQQHQQYHLLGSAGLILVDWLTSGRTACGERWAFTRYFSRNDIWRDDEPVLADALLLDPADGPLDSACRMGRFNCLALVVLAGEPLKNVSHELLDQVNSEPLPNANSEHTAWSAASRIRHGAVLRVVGTSTEAVARYIHQRLADVVSSLLGEDPWARKW